MMRGPEPKAPGHWRTVLLLSPGQPLLPPCAVTLQPRHAALLLPPLFARPLLLLFAAILPPPCAALLPLHGSLPRLAPPPVELAAGQPSHRRWLIRSPALLLPVHGLT